MINLYHSLGKFNKMMIFFSYFSPANRFSPSMQIVSVIKETICIEGEKAYFLTKKKKKKKREIIFQNIVC